MSMFDEGVVALVPVTVTEDPRKTDSYDILSMRTAKITEWFPYSVRLDCYDDRNGQHRQVVCRKDEVAIIQNPFYSVMNNPISTMSRLVRKLNLLDTIDSKTGSDRLDLIIQLPYGIKTETQRAKANDRLRDIEDQLAHSPYGIAYIDASEHITQLNRAVENNLLKQVEYLQNLLFSQLGLTEGILNQTADQATMQNYYARLIEPCVSAFCDELKRKYLTKTARTQRQSIMFFRDPFKIVPVGDMADFADKFTRNAILSSNEFRGIIGFKPVNDPDADALRNKNLNQSSEELSGEVSIPTTKDTKTDSVGKKETNQTDAKLALGRAIVQKILGGNQNGF